MATTKVQSEHIAINAISGTIIADNAVTSVHIAQNAILTQHIDDGQVGTAQLAADAVTGAKLADSSIVTANIQDDQVTGDKLTDNITIAGTLGVTGETTLSTHLNMGDADRIKLGADGDFEIYHDDPNSTIKNGGPGSLYIRSDNNVIITNQNTSKNSIHADTDGAVTLYYDNAAKLETASGGVTVTGDITASGTIGSNSTALRGTSLSIDSRLTLHDGEIDNASGDLTLDSAGDIILDADGADIQFKDGGTEFGRVFGSSDNFYIQSRQSDKDMHFQGIDGSSTINALILDMSAAGYATFNDGIKADGVELTNGGGAAGGTTPKLYSANGGTFAISANSAERIVVDGPNNRTKIVHDLWCNANVGIGTASPGYLLHVSKVTPANDLTMLRLSNGDGSDGGSDLAQQSTHIDFEFKDSNSNVVPQARISGHVGNGSDADSTTKEGQGFLTFHTSNTSNDSGEEDPDERLRITHDGNVGIGVVPEADVGGGAAVFTNLQFGGCGNLFAKTAGVDGIHLAKNYYIGDNSGVAQDRHIGTGTATDISVDTDIKFRMAASASADAAASWSNNVIFKADGKVGIGDTDPDTKLHVAGNVKLGSAASSSWSTSSHDLGGLDVFVGSGSKGLTVWDDNYQSAPRFTVLRAGNVGIGTASPGSLLHAEQDGVAISTTNLDNGTAVGLQVTMPNDTFSSGEGVAIGLGMNGRARSYLAHTHVGTNRDAADLSIYTETGGVIGERVRVLHNGRVGIGNSSPVAPLMVQGDGASGQFTALALRHDDSDGDNNTNMTCDIDFYLWDSNTRQSVPQGRIGLSSIDVGNQNTEASGTLSFYTTPSGYPSSAVLERLRITNTGRQKYNASATENGHGNFVGEVGVSYKALSFEHTVGGGEVGKIVTTSSTVALSNSSDYRLKENINYTWDATTRLKQLKPCRFNWIIDETNTLSDGFLAHEVSDHVPEAVYGEKDGTDEDGNPDHQGIDQSKLVPLLVKTIQELEARITVLEG